MAKHFNIKKVISGAMLALFAVTLLAQETARAEQASCSGFFVTDAN